MRLNWPPKHWSVGSNFLVGIFPKLSSFLVVLLLLTGRCYEAEICAILLLLRCSFRWYPFLPKSKFSDFGRKPWTIYKSGVLSEIELIFRGPVTPHWKVL